MSNFITIKVKQDSNGFNLFIKSAKLEEFCRSLHRSLGYSNDYIELEDEVKAYRVGSDPAVEAFRLWGYGLYHKGLPNLSFFTTMGLSEGVTSKLDFPLSESVLDMYCKDVKEYCAYLYKEYMYPFEIEEVITND